MSDARSEHGRRWSRIPIWAAYTGIAALAFSVPLGVRSDADRSFAILLGSVGISAAAAVIALIVTLLRPNDAKAARPLDKDNYETARLVCFAVSMAFLGKTLLRLYQAQQGGDLDLLVEDIQTGRVDSVAAAIWFLLCVPKRLCVQQRQLIFALTVAALVLLRFMTPDTWSGIYGFAALYFLSISLRPTFEDQGLSGKGGHSDDNGQAGASYTSGVSNDLPSTTSSSFTNSKLRHSDTELQPIAAGESSSDFEEKYALLLKYSDKAKAAAARLSGVPQDVLEEFRRGAVAEPARVDDIATELLATLAGRNAPFAGPEANRRYAQLEPLGWQAQAEFRKVLELLGAEADVEKVAIQIVQESSVFKIEADKVERIGRRFSWGGFLLEDSEEMHRVIAEKILADARAFQALGVSYTSSPVNNAKPSFTRSHR